MKEDNLYLFTKILFFLKAMMFFLFRIIFTLFLFGTTAAQSYSVSVEEKSSHSNWGTAWGKIYVAKNDLITIAVVPALGGRVMQYDLGTHPSIYVDNNAIGSIPDNGNVQIGGFRMLPSPQSDFGWPSPPELDLNPYTCVVRVKSTDSTVILLESGVVNNGESKYAKHQGLRFKRQLTLYKASTRVKVEMTMINTGNTVMKHGIWDITQSICSNNNRVDLENIWVYFKKNESSSMSKGYIEYSELADGSGGEKAQWKPNAAEGGIMGVQFLQKAGKIGADCNAGWICYVDRLDGYSYAKTFTYEEGENYPDGGASVQVYTSKNTSTPLVEVEVLGPIATLGQNDSVKLVENWYAARSFGPILDVCSAGLITKRLTVDQTENSIAVAGTYGVFYPGAVRVVLVNDSGREVAAVDSLEVTPLDSVSLAKTYRLTAGATILVLKAYDLYGEMTGILDSVTVPDPINVTESVRQNPTANRSIAFHQYKEAVYVTIPYGGKYTLELFTVEGELLSCSTGLGLSRHRISVPYSSVNIFIARINGDRKTVHIPFIRLPN